MIVNPAFARAGARFAADGVAVSVVGIEHADLLVRLDQVPLRDVGLVEFAAAEAEVIGPFERRRLPGLGAASEIPGFPRHDGRHARHAGGFAGVRDRIDRLGGRDGEHHVDLVGIDQRLGELAGARRIGLRVPVEDFDPIGLVADLQARGERLAREFEDVAVGLAETAERSRARADESDLERRLGASRESAVGSGGRREAGGAGGHDQRASRY